MMLIFVLMVVKIIIGYAIVEQGALRKLDIQNQLMLIGVRSKQWKYL